MRVSRVIGTLAVAAAMLAVPVSSAAAQSTTIYPAGDTISVSSGPVTVTTAFKQVDTCMFNGGSFAIPTSNHSGSGPIVAKFTVRPTITECSGPASLKFASQETWTVSLEDLASPIINIPPQGIMCNGEAAPGGSQTLPGGMWWNGFSSPASVPSSLVFGGATLETGGACFHDTFGPSIHTLTDVTQPGTLPLIGP